MGDKRSPSPSLTLRRALSQISLPRVRLSCRTQTSQSSWKEMSRELRRAGMTPKRRHKTDCSFSMKPRMPLLAMLKTMKQLLQSLKLQRRRSRRLRKCSILKLPMLTSRRDKTFLRRAPIPLMDSLTPSMPIWPQCPSQFPRTRKRFLPRKLQLSRKSLRSLDVSPPQLRRLRILLLILLLSITPSRLLIHGKMLQQLSLVISRKLPEPCSLKTELPELWTFRPTPRLSVTNTPTMLSSGLNTELVSRSSPPGWLVPRRLLEKVLAFDKNCVNYLKVLMSAQGAAQKMTTHAEA